MVAAMNGGASAICGEVDVGVRQRLRMLCGEVTQCLWAARADEEQRSRRRLEVGSGQVGQSVGGCRIPRLGEHHV